MSECTRGEQPIEIQLYKGRKIDYKHAKIRETLLSKSLVPNRTGKLSVRFWLEIFSAFILQHTQYNISTNLLQEIDPFSKL